MDNNNNINNHDRIDGVNDKRRTLIMTMMVDIVIILMMMVD